MNNILVLITSAFPFQSGEEFLLAETAYYGVFKKVYIMPVMARDFSKRKNISPDIVVLKIENVASESRVRKTVSCIRALQYKDVKAEINHLKKSGRFSLSAMRQLLVDGNKVHAVLEEVCDSLERIRKENPSESVIVYSYWMGIHAKIASELKKRFPDIKIVTRCHGGDLYEYRYPSDYIPFRSVIFENEDVIFPISENGKAYLEERYGNLLPSVEVSRLGTKQVYGRTVIGNTEGIHLVSCSYCIPLKRIELIIKALAGIRDRKITWTHIGNGRELDRLKQLAAESLPENIPYEFLGYVENTKIQEFYAAGKYNVFVNVSETEGIPVSIMEAMSYGLPVIATDVGGVSEMVEEGSNGYLLPKEFDIEQLRDFILALHGMKQDAFRDMSEKSHAIWQEKFNADRNYMGFVQKLIHL